MTKTMVTLVVTYDETEVPHPKRWDWNSLLSLSDVGFELVGAEEFRMPDSLTPT